MYKYIDKLRDSYIFFSLYIDKLKNNSVVVTKKFFFQRRSWKQDKERRW